MMILIDVYGKCFLFAKSLSTYIIKLTITNQTIKGWFSIPCTLIYPHHPLYLGNNRLLMTIAHANATFMSNIQN